MSVPVTCRACGARLKLPPGLTKKKARCPKCNARVDITAALNQSAYLPTVTIPPAAPPPPPPPEPVKVSRPVAPPAAPARVVSAPSPSPAKPVQPPPAPPAPPPPRPAPVPVRHILDDREDDPLPYADLNPAARPAPKPFVPPTTAPAKPVAPAPPPAPARPTPLPLDDPPLSLDDDPPADAKPAAPAEPPPFRVPVRVTTDTAKQFTGPCEAVLVPHGMFLEAVPYRPFLYVPCRCPVNAPGNGGLSVTLPDGRAVALEFTGRDGVKLADDTAAFLAGERGVPTAREYRRLWRTVRAVAVGLLALAAVLPAGWYAAAELAPPEILAEMRFAATVVLAGLVVNAVVLFSGISGMKKLGVAAGVGVLMAGAAMYGATAHMAWKKQSGEPPLPPGAPPRPRPGMPNPPPDPGEDPPPRYPPTAVDQAYKTGVFRFPDGPDDVTALAVGADWSVLVVGYKNGATQTWRFEQLAVDPFGLGPKSDGPPTRVVFDGTSTITYTSCPGGAVAAQWNTPPDVPVKLPGDLLAFHPFPTGDRFAAVRGNLLVIRNVPTTMVRTPPPPPKGAKFLPTIPKDEVIPMGVAAQFGVPGGRPTFLAWHPTGRLLAGQNDGGIAAWSPAGGALPQTREHKAAVRAWAASPDTWDFATGDDKGVIGVWAGKATAPRTFEAARAAITHLAFSPSGSHLAALDAEGGLVVWDWDIPARVVAKARRPSAKVMTYGPQDDLLIFSDGKAVEMWHIPELDRRP